MAVYLHPTHVARFYGHAELQRFWSAKGFDVYLTPGSPFATVEPKPVLVREPVNGGVVQRVGGFEFRKFWRLP